MCVWAEQYTQLLSRDQIVFLSTADLVSHGVGLQSVVVMAVMTFNGTFGYCLALKTGPPLLNDRYIHT